MTVEPWGRQLKRWRTVAGLGRGKLAALSKVSERNITNLEEKGQQPSAATTKALTDALTTALSAVEVGAWSPEERATFAAGPHRSSSTAQPTDPRFDPRGDGDAQGAADQARYVGVALGPRREPAASGVGDPPITAFAAPHSGDAEAPSPTPSEQPAPSGPPAAADTSTVLVRADLNADESAQSVALVQVMHPLTRAATPLRRQPAGRRIVLGSWALGLLALLAVGVVLVIKLQNSLDTPSSSGRIAVPEPGSRVTSPLDLRGFATVGGDEQLWVLVKTRSNSFYTVTNYPAPVAVDPRGDWTVLTVGLGKTDNDIGKRFELFLVVSPSNGPIAEAVRQIPPGHHSAEFKQLPDDTTVLDSVHVELGARS